MCAAVFGGGQSRRSRERDKGALIETIGGRGRALANVNTPAEYADREAFEEHQL
jgi:molybdopterin-guanine dinucleotide biosynthesis protein A